MSPINNFFPGKMYDVRMYNYALSAGQVSDVFNPPALPSSKEITSFTLPGIGNATILGSNISMTVPHSTIVAALAPTYVHTGASSTPVSGSTQNFNTPQTYTITAGNASTANYTVTVTKAPISTACDMLSLSLGSYSSSIVGTSVTLYVPPGTDVTNLSPTFTVSPFATASPLSGSTHNFTSPVNYVVTAENGIATKTYSVTVAQTNFWISNAGDSWSTDTSWDPAVVPTSASTTVLGFFTAGTYASTHDLGDDFQVNQLVFGAPVLTLGGQSLLFSGTAPALVQSGTAAVTISSALNLGTATSVGGSGTGAVSLSGAISGGSLTKLSPGNLTLSGANTYSGGTTHSSGMLTVGARTALGSGSVTLAGGTNLQQVNFEGFGAGGTLANNFTLSGGLVNLAFDFGTTKDMTLNGVVSGAGGFHLSGARRGLTLAGDNTFSGGVTVDAAPDGLRIAASHVNALGTGPLSLGAGAQAQLNYAGDHVLPSLTLNGVVQPNGTYGSTASGASTIDDAHFTGTGTVTVGPHKQAKILTFVVAGSLATTINQINLTIGVTVPSGTDVTTLAPTYTVSPRATSTPASGDVRDFSTPRTYSVTSEDTLTTQVYTVTVILGAPPVATVSGISGPVAGPGVGEFTVTITGSSDTAGNLGVEMSTDLLIWTPVQTTPVLGGAFSIPVTFVGEEPKAFFRLSGQ